jgi:phosphoribosylaminoimidazole carboxylase (NCAIR synthetase)
VRTVAFVAPFLLPTTARFVRAVTALHNVRVIAITQEPPKQSLGLAGVQPCTDVHDDAALGAALDAIIAEVGPIHRLVGVLESAQEPMARQRERLGLPGLKPAAAHRFRDKDAMKAALRAAGVPVAASIKVDGPGDPDAILAAVGLPLVLKPIAGAGAAATVRVATAADLARALPQLPRPLIAEGFLTGAEHSLESWVLGGQVRFQSATRYYPTALEVADNPHLQWCVHLPRDPAPFADAAAVVSRAVLALGLEDGLAHAEWFRRPDGSIAIGEIGARPPGAGLMDLHGHAHEADWFAAWARVVVDDAFDGPWPRRWSVAGVYVRGPGTGKVVAIDGLEEAQRRIGVHVVEARLPRTGMPRASGYEGDGFVILKHEDDEVVKRAVLQLFDTLRVRYA